VSRRARGGFPRPRRTLQLRLALFYGGLFLISGFLLLAIPNVLVRAGTGSVHIVPGPAGFPLRKAITLQQRGADVHQQLVFSLLALVVMVVLSFALGWVAAGRVLRPLRLIVSTTQEISASSLHRRLVLEGPDDEFRELGATLNSLLGRLEASFDSQRRFVANVSHELRTPLTAERTLLQVALADPDASAESLRAACQELLTLNDQQRQLIDDLLTLTQSERGIERWEPVDLARVAEQAVTALRHAAQDQDISLEVDLALAPVRGDPGLAGILVTNLVDNAVRYNVPGGWVEVVTTASAEEAVLSVRNSGPVITPTEMDRLFQPFWRQGGERQGHPEGHGLGLAIVQAVATAHHAQVRARARAHGGLHIEVVFPRGTPPGPHPGPRPELSVPAS
jgi:signal transduction histidine kinase